jgi:tRNA-splicing ligase RtcB
VNVKTFGPVDQRSLDQLRRCMDAGDAEFGVLCADHHPGYSQPIGGGVAYEGYISPSGVGYDVACLAAGSQITTTEGFTIPVEAVTSRDPIACFDNGVVRRVDPHSGAVSQRLRATIAIELVNRRRLVVTRDHLLLTRTGWREAGCLVGDDEVLVSPFVGLAHESYQLAPAIIRLLAYSAGDGHLSRDKKRVALYTTVEADAKALASDFIAIGCKPSTYRRSRASHRPREISVYVTSTDLHARLAELGSPVGKKRWPRHPMPWLFDTPAWVRAQFLSAFASAEMCTPRVVNGGIANLALKQADANAANFVADLLVSLGFRASVAPSASHWVVQVLGGDEEKVRFFEDVGFSRAALKRHAAAAAASVAWQRLCLVAHRQAAVAEAGRLIAAGCARRVVIADVAKDFVVPEGFLTFALRNPNRPRRRGQGVHHEPATHGEACWVGIRDIVDAGVAEVWDVVTGDPAESFLAEGIVVHNCGNKAVQTNMRAEELDVPRVMREIERRISFGTGVPARERVDHPVLDKIKVADFEPQRKLHELAVNQLGTVGSGNHYVNVFEDEEGLVWVGVHFGSRGFGHKTASGFLALAQGLPFDARAREGEMDSPPVLFEADSELGRAYISAMELAGEYAYAGRDTVCAKVLEILGAKAVHEVHNNHNFGWREEHGGRQYWVIRKGCTPARPGQEGFVGGSMGDESVILEGVEDPENEEALYSTVHGAGRVMSRSHAAGRMRMASVYACTVRDCDYAVPAKDYTGPGRCPIHDAKLKKMRARIQVKPGVVDWPAVQRRLREQGIVLVGGGADEAPEVYKRLPDVLAAHGSTIRIKHRLKPLGVAMAGGDVVDPYKD